MSINTEMIDFPSVDLRGSLCLCGEWMVRRLHHRDTELAQSSTEHNRKGCRNSRRAAVVVLFCLLLFFGFNPVIAKDARPNEDPQIEQRMKALTEQLRCLVCQNETLADSRADLAEDLRKQIREQMKAGKSDKEIIAFLTARYGDFVLYKPPMKSTTYLLWFGPFVLLVGGTAVLFRFLRRRRDMIQEKPLSLDERKRAEEILRSA